jgi:methyltransferase (TIGR00027 family)
VVDLPWDFEHQPPAQLPAALASLGHDPTRPTLTIWEGVIAYLTEPAIEATVAAVRALSAPLSPFAFTYLERRFLAQRARARFLRSLLNRVGEPFRFGWDPAELPAWLAARGFSLESDRPANEAARELLPPAYAALVQDPTSHIALARRIPATG